MKQHTVLSTSGWQGDKWHVAGTFDTAKQSEELRASIHTTNARLNGYITTIVRSAGRACATCSGECWIFNLTGKKYQRFEPHLRGMVHAQVPSINLQGGPHGSSQNT